MRFKLSPYIKTSYFLPAVAQSGNGRQRIRYQIEPDTEYETNDYKDKTPNIDDLIRNQITFVPYSTKMKAELDKIGAKYTTKGCASCGGRITQIKLQVFEVIS